MRGRGALLPNFGFEYELAGRPVPSVVARQVERFSHILRLVPGFREAVLVADHPGAERVVAWGPSGAARDRVVPVAAERWPSPDVTRTANDKRTSHRLERELGIALPGACIVSSLGDVRAAAREVGGAWIAKHPFGVAGRGRCGGEGGDLDADDERALRRLLADASLVFEPRVELDDEYSVHFDVDEGGVRYVGTCGLFTHRGTFRGNEAPIDRPDWLSGDSAVVAERLAALGWRGPLAIDAFSGRLAGQEVRRAVCEINARWTFGRLTLELCRELKVSSLRWHHPPRADDATHLEPVRAPARPGRWQLPEWCDPGGASGTFIEIS